MTSAAGCPPDEHLSQGEAPARAHLANPRPRRFLAQFVLLRHADVSGVSGLGIVAAGRQLWPNGPCIIHWRGRWRTLVLHYQGIASVEAIHGHSGKTEVIWL